MTDNDGRRKIQMVRIRRNVDLCLYRLGFGRVDGKI